MTSPSGPTTSCRDRTLSDDAWSSRERRAHEHHGHLVTFAGAAGVPPFELLTFYTYIGVAWLVLLATPLLRWRRSWARVAVPATVLLTCAGLVALGEGELPLVLFVTLPVLVAGGALVAGLVRLRRGAGREQVVEDVVGGSAKP